MSFVNAGSPTTLAATLAKLDEGMRHVDAGRRRIQEGYALLRQRSGVDATETGDEAPIRLRVLDGPNPPREAQDIGAIVTAEMDRERKRLTRAGLLFIRLDIQVGGTACMLEDGVRSEGLSPQKARLILIWAQNWLVLKEQRGEAQPDWEPCDGYISYKRLVEAYDAVAAPWKLKRENANSAVHKLRDWLAAREFSPEMIQVKRGVGSRLGTDDVRVTALDSEGEELIKRARSALVDAHGKGAHS